VRLSSHIHLQSYHLKQHLLRLLSTNAPYQQTMMSNLTTLESVCWVFSNHYTFSLDIDVWSYHLRERLQRPFPTTTPSHQTLMSDITTSESVYWVFSFSSDINVWYYHLTERSLRLLLFVRHWYLIWRSRKAVTAFLRQPSPSTLLTSHIHLRSH
jgi:hypothetical protein